MAQRKEVLLPQQTEKPSTKEELKPEDYVTKIKTAAEIKLPKPVIDDNGAQILTPAQPQNVKITLPLTNQKTVAGLSKKVNSSFRWLSEWVKRTIKLAGNKFIYKYGKD